MKWICNAPTYSVSLYLAGLPGCIDDYVLGEARDYKGYKFGCFGTHWKGIYRKKSNGM